MKKLLKKALALSLALMLPSVTISCKAEKTETAPKYVFFFIGDGFGLSQTIITEGYLGTMDGKVAPTELMLSTFPSTGFYTTHCFERFITDSAAGGTALATGSKTTDGTIGLDHEGNRVENIAENLHGKGMKVGIISTASIDHATPACFYAHQPSREMYYNISQELPLSGFEFFGGGGVLVPEPKIGKTFAEQAEENGYRIVNTKEEIEKLANGDEKVIAIAPNLQDSKSVTYAIDQKEGDMCLADFVGKAIEVLNNPKGFFIMAEGGKIDWLCHANDVASTIREVIDFDNAVKKAYEFYLEHPDETLIIVCADHETGGMAPGTTLKEYDSDYTVFSGQKISYYEFENMVEDYRDSRKNHDYDEAMKAVEEYFGLKAEQLTDYDTKRLKKAFKISMQPWNERTHDLESYDLYGGYDPFTTTVTKILAEKGGVGTTSFVHTATPVIIHSIGTGSQLFEGRFDNIDVPTKLLSLFE